MLSFDFSFPLEIMQEKTGRLVDSASSAASNAAESAKEVNTKDLFSRLVYNFDECLAISEFFKHAS
jgi:hypothetical protein